MTLINNKIIAVPFIRNFVIQMRSIEKKQPTTFTHIILKLNPCACRSITIKIQTKEIARNVTKGQTKRKIPCLLFVARDITFVLFPWIRVGNRNENDDATHEL